MTLIWSTPDPLIALLSSARRIGTCLVWRDGDTVERVRLHAHRLVHGPLPEGRGLRTLCGTPWCVNPFHYEPHRVNVRNGVTHCVVGHAYERGSFYLQPNGRGGLAKVCKACFNERRRAWRERRRQLAA